MADPFQASKQIKPDQIIDILLRGKWIIIIPLCISLTVGLLVTLTSDKTYEASTLILVQPQRVPTNYVQSVVTSTINQRISTISQQILSRSNLEKIIDQFGLYEDAESMYLEDKIAGMRKKIQVKIEQGRRQGTEAFSISYQGSDPQRVMRIANTLASYFMDENLKVREAQAIGTSEFLDAELEKTKKRLEDRERKLAEYRTKYMGGLPDELQTNFRSLDMLNQRRLAKNAELIETKKMINMLETQIAQAKEMAAMDQGMGIFEYEEAGEDDFLDSEDEKKLEAAQKAYDNLLLKYTEKHPDVAKLKKTIEKLEASIAEAQKELMEETPEAAGKEASIEEPQAGVTPNFAVIQMETQLRQVKEEVQRALSDIRKIEEEMKIYQTRIEDTPKRELELQALKRDYKNIQDVYNSLLDRKLEAELSVNMEKKQKGEQFRILDHARLPEKPISPNVTLSFLFSLVSGAGAGGGVVLLLELINFSVIRRDDQIETTLGLNILATIPPLEKPSDRVVQRFKTVAFVSFCGYAALFIGFFAVLNMKGIDRTIDFLKIHLGI